jgi:hypothetical protein
MKNLEPSNFRATYKRTPRQARIAKKQGEGDLLPIISNTNVSIKDKRELIQLHNPFFYVFGTELIALTDVNKLYGDENDQVEQ